MSAIRDYLLLRKVKQKKLHQQQRSLNNHQSVYGRSDQYIPTIQMDDFHHIRDYCDEIDGDKVLDVSNDDDVITSPQLTSPRPSLIRVQKGGGSIGCENTIWNGINWPTFVNFLRKNNQENSSSGQNNGSNDNNNNDDAKPRLYMDLNHEGRPRLVKKNGQLNIDVESVPERKRRLLKDFFNTILDIKWRWHIVFFLMTFLISWIVFASVWYLIGIKSLKFKFYSFEYIDSPE